jgi:hypothetical protein
MDLYILYELLLGLCMIPFSCSFFDTAVSIRVTFSFANSWTNYIHVARDGELVLSGEFAVGISPSSPLFLSVASPYAQPKSFVSQYGADAGLPQNVSICPFGYGMTGF